MMKKIFLLNAFFWVALLASAQTMTESDYIRKGNHLYADSLYEKAEIEYRKALELNPESALFYQIPQSQEKAQEKGQEAMQQYATVSKLEMDKKKLAQINHNLGTLLYMAQQYAQSVEAYKEALRKNPADEDTRYNLAVVLYLMKQYQQQNQSPQGGSGLQGNGQEQQEQEKQEEKEEKEEKEKMEQMLKALRQDEKEIREKMEETEKVKVRDSYIEKNW